MMKLTCEDLTISYKSFECKISTFFMEWKYLTIFETKYLLAILLRL